MDPAVTYRTLIYTIETYIYRTHINNGVSRVHGSLEELAEDNTEFLWRWRWAEFIHFKEINRFPMFKNSPIVCPKP